MRLGKINLLVAAVVFATVNLLLFLRFSSRHFGNDLHPLAESREEVKTSRRELGGSQTASQVSRGRDCQDTGDHCPGRAQAGDCVADAAWALHSCHQSCGICLFYDKLKMNVRKKVQLNNGQLMPTVGFGTAGLAADTSKAVLEALSVGYKLIDTAQATEWYNELAVGQAVASSGVDRNSLFLTSKLHPRHFGKAAAKFKDSLSNLQTTYIDLMLLHYPSCGGALCTQDEEVSAGTWQAAWRELEELVAAGKIRALGVSNFGLEELAGLVKFAKTKPSVIQSQSDPLRPNVAVQVFCERAGIQFQGYSTLGSQWLMQGHQHNPILTDPDIIYIAENHDVSPAQVVLRWALQHGQVVIPRSMDSAHMAENLAVLTSLRLGYHEMRRIDSLDGSKD